MEFVLRCNSLKCRKELNDHAVVTTCSHVFCIDCSNHSQLSVNPHEGRRATCPACDMHLPNPDDVVVTNLNPSEDYKTSVLSGLSPNVIMECAGRALSFWAYQTTQEIVYQEYLAKTLTDKYTTLNTQMDKIIHDANSEISNLRNRMMGKLSAETWFRYSSDQIIGMSADQDALRRKNEELGQSLRDKNKKLMQTQELYDKMKRRGMLDQVQNAASNAVDDTIQASMTGHGSYGDGSENEHHRPPQVPLYANQHTGGSNNPGGGYQNTTMPPPPLRKRSNDWPGFGTQGSGQSSQRQTQPQQTPSTHRQPLTGAHFPPPGPGASSLRNHNSMSGTPLPQSTLRSTTGRVSAPGLSGNSGQTPGFSGYGMRAGLKVGNSGGTPIAAGFARPSVRSVAQRPASNLTFSRDSGLGTPSITRGNYY